MAAIFKSGNTAVITGGASGIGLALARKCVQAGMKVLVADWNQENLDAASENAGGAVTTFKMDVSKTQDWGGLTRLVESELDGKVSLLALNAGIGRPFSWDDVAGFRAIIDTNLFGVVNGIAALLPAVKRAAAADKPAAVVITGSKQGITQPPGNPAYNASKSAVKSVAEGLSYDLRNEKGVGVHLLVPGWTYTGMMGNKPGASEGQNQPKGSWLPQQVVDFLVGKMDEGKFYVICPDDDVTEEMDRRRMRWAMGDLVEGRPALSRWREDWKDRAKAELEK